MAISSRQERSQAQDRQARLGAGDRPNGHNAPGPHVNAGAISLRNLSHELHPSVLQHSGLVPTLRRHCADVEELHHLEVSFSARDNLDSLTPAVALCLFRVAQEALGNAARHARASTIRVELMTTHEGVELRVVDNGIGFVASERAGSGLGLRSIDERVRLTKGSVTQAARLARRNRTEFYKLLQRHGIEAAIFKHEVQK